MLLQFFPELSLALTLLTGKYEAFSGLLITCIVSAVLKEIGKQYLGSFCLRPRDAKDCTLWRKGRCGHEPGLPSTHSSVAGYLYANLVFRKECLAGLLVVVPVSRVVRNCHTVFQTVIGVLLGIVIFICQTALS